MNVYTVTGKAIALKEPALKAGGEGAVYEIIGYPNKVAKIYHDSADAKRRENKINEMVKISEGYSFKSSNITQDIAWPLSPLFDKNKQFIGFGMNRISASTELDDLYIYPPKQNINVTIEDRITCLISLCDVINELHTAGQVFGDFNPNNIKINSDWTVKFVDADSYHVKNAGKEFRCVVCAPGYVAPELIKACKGTTYADCKGTTFTKETDNFALAIHCFRMLMNGCHPYICQRQLKRAGSAPAPKSTDKRVECGETPFFKVVSNHTTPSYAPDINSLPSYIRDLFKKAFVDGHSVPSLRPNAMEWKKALLKYKGEITICKDNSTHYYWKANGVCPYCEADKKYATQMSKNLPARFISGGNTTRNQSKSTTVKMPKVASSINTQKVNITGMKTPFAFWTITIILSLVLLCVLGIYVLPFIYDSIAGEEIVTMIGVIGGCIAGIVGTIIYNCCWTVHPGGPYDWYEYVLSLVTCLAFAFGFGVVMGLVCLIAVVLFYILAGVFIIGIIAAIFSGG